LLIAGIVLANLNLLLLWAVATDQINNKDMSCSDFAAVFLCCRLLIILPHVRVYTGAALDVLLAAIEYFLC
jgi:hypothetical protein